MAMVTTEINRKLTAIIVVVAVVVAVARVLSLLTYQQNIHIQQC